MKEYARLHAIGFGAAMGILWSFSVLLMAILVMTLDWGGEFVSALGSLYIGYDASISGGLIGAAWGFLDGFVGGAVFVWIYNGITCKILRLCG